MAACAAPRLVASVVVFLFVILGRNGRTLRVYLRIFQIRRIRIESKIFFPRTLFRRMRPFIVM
ncbi:hypothetical protein NJ69_07665 [Pseudomonas parafulva]|nr:hypothetical protein NJ69_07665 [Pseudomonas parafulva]